MLYQITHTIQKFVKHSKCSLLRDSFLASVTVTYIMFRGLQAYRFYVLSTPSMQASKINNISIEFLVLVQVCKAEVEMKSTETSAIQFFLIKTI